ncbi:MAG: hypothetical protein HY790_03405 [Deltaproteobacteria bacterium]|nr:hypothetical protein [Deltaproteobacteria bacterium]
MKKCGIFILASLLCLLLVSAPWAQPRGDGETAPVQYDLKTVETLSGIVVAAPQPSAKGGMPERAQLTLKTEKETFIVYRGPGWFVEKVDLEDGKGNLYRLPGTGLVCGKAGDENRQLGSDSGHRLPDYGPGQTRSWPQKCAKGTRF